MNLKETLSFKQLREKGPNAIDLKSDEVVQLVSRGTNGIKVIITQEFFLKLLSSFQNTAHSGGDDVPTVQVDFNKKLQMLETKVTKLLELSEQE